MRTLAMIALLAGCSFQAKSASSSSGGNANDAAPAHPDAALAVDAPIMIDAQVDAARTCPAGYAAIAGGPAGSKYKIFGYAPGMTSGQHWPTAAQTCMNDGTHLAIPETAGELTALGNAIPVEGSSPYFWVGLTDEQTEGTWLTVLGAPAPYLPWGSQQPNGGTNANCAIAYQGLLYDWGCTDYPYPFACECE